MTGKMGRRVGAGTGKLGKDRETEGPWPPSGTPVPGDEIGQQQQPGALTFFRMELGSEDISPRNRASKRRWVGGRRRRQSGILRHRMKTMGKIEPGVLLDALPQRMRPRL